MRLADAALAHAYRGWPVFPVHRVKDGRCSCGRKADDEHREAGKHPRTRNGLHDATTDPERIATYWNRWPDANVGFPTGALVVVDVDGPTGVASMTALRAEHPWPQTLTSMSGRPGLHMFFRPDGEVRNAAGLRGSRGLGHGIDVRAVGGYVLLPPSSHPSGRAYQWINRAPVAPMPAWMHERLRPVSSIDTWDMPATAGDSYGRAALIGECDEVASAPEGTLNDTLNRAAFKLGRLVTHGALREGEVRDALLGAALGNGHPERGARRTIDSGLVAGMRKSGR